MSTLVATRPGQSKVSGPIFKNLAIAASIDPEETEVETDRDDADRIRLEVLDGVQFEHTNPL